MKQSQKIGCKRKWRKYPLTFYFTVHPTCFGAGCFIKTVHSYHHPRVNTYSSEGEIGFSAKNGP